MGGNALKDVKTRRYQHDEYLALELEVVRKLEELFPHEDVGTIPFYSRKSDFGDMDLLLTSICLPNDWIQKIEATFLPKQKVKNGNVLSFEYKEFQIDVIVTPVEEFATSLRYFAYNDLGNLLGRIAHSMGLKLGHDGLSYNWRVETYQFRNVVISKNWDEILTVLGYDPTRYAEGFDTLESIFEFVASGKFFNSDIYLLHNRNHVSRVRDAKRKTYMKFLEWCGEVGRPLWNYPRKADKADWLPYLFEALPEFKATYDKVQAEWERAVEFKRRYNGDVVKAHTGLEGKELGSFMKWMNENVLVEFQVMSMSAETFPHWLDYWHSSYLELCDSTGHAISLCEAVEQAKRNKE